MNHQSLEEANQELKILKKEHPEHLEYIKDCERNKVQPSIISAWVRSRIEVLQLVGENIELQEIYAELEDQINNPETIIRIIKTYTSAVKYAEEHPELGIDKKTLRLSIGNITNLLAAMQNQSTQIKN